MLRISEFKDDHIHEAAELFKRSYDARCDTNPLIPKKEDLKNYVISKLKEKFGNPGVAALDDNELVGYMKETGRAEEFMSKRTPFSLGLYSHSSVEQNKEKIYQKMYEGLSRTWIEEGFHSHVFSFWATDDILQSTFFRLGFGMTHFELMRDLSRPEKPDIDVTIREIDNPNPIRKLDRDHHDFYPKAPLFWIPHGEYDPEHDFEGDIIAAFDGDEAIAYIHLTVNDAETPLLASEDIGRVAGAYADPKYRNKGVGTALLREVVKWAKENHLKNLYVEGESANIQGGNFWMKHFEPVVYTVRRCVDERV